MFSCAFLTLSLSLSLLLFEAGGRSRFDERKSTRSRGNAAEEFHVHGRASASGCIGAIKLHAMDLPSTKPNLRLPREKEVRVGDSSCACTDVNRAIGWCECECECTEGSVSLSLSLSLAERNVNSAGRGSSLGDRVRLALSQEGGKNSRNASLFRQSGACYAMQRVSGSNARIVSVRAPRAEIPHAETRSRGSDRMTRSIAPCANDGSEKRAALLAVIVQRC